MINTTESGLSSQEPPKANPSKELTIFNPKLGRALRITQLVDEKQVIDDKYEMFISYLQCGVIHDNIKSTMISPYELTLEDKSKPLKRGVLSMYGIKLVSWELL